MRLATSGFVLIGLCLLGILVHSVYRDVQLEKQYPGDLRNRVVGARLQKEGILPYFFHWNPKDGIRFWDPETCNQRPGDASRVTATPFFHELLFPICDLPMRSIAQIWWWMEYAMFAAMVWMFCCLTPDRSKKMMIITAGILFTTTEAWKLLILLGQLYFFVAFLMACVITGLVLHKKSLMVLAGICAAAFVLTRPIALVMFMPFLFQYKQHRLFLLTAVGGLVLYGLSVLCIPSENALWKDYARAMRVHVGYHQAANPSRNLEPCPMPDHLEGFEYSEIKKSVAAYPVHFYTEYGNVFVIYHLIFHKHMPLIVLNILSALVVVSLSLLFFYFFRDREPSIWQILIFGLTLYMLVEIFGPVHRSQYNSTQWLPVLLAGLLAVGSWKKPAFILLALGLALNISNAPWLLMRHTLGELSWIGASLLIVFTGPPEESADH